VDRLPLSVVLSYWKGKKRKKFIFCDGNAFPVWRENTSLFSRRKGKERYTHVRRKKYRA